MSLGFRRTSGFSSGERIILSRSTLIRSFLSPWLRRISTRLVAASGVTPPAWEIALSTVRSPVDLYAPGRLDLAVDVDRIGHGDHDRVTDLELEVLADVALLDELGEVDGDAPDRRAG